MASVDFAFATPNAATSTAGAQHVAWIMDRSADAAVLTDSRGVIEYVNPAFEELTGYSPHEVIGRTPAILKSGVQTREFYRDLWRTLADGREFSGVFVNRR